jgi:hypothetical protein
MQALESGSLRSWWLVELLDGRLNFLSGHLERLDVQASLGDQVITDHQDSDAHNTQSLSRIGPSSFLLSGIQTALSVHRWLAAAEPKAFDDLICLLLRQLSDPNNDAVLIRLQRLQSVQLRLEKTDRHEVTTPAGKEGGYLLE